MGENSQKDIALDYAFFGNRLRGSIEYYHRTTDGLILTYQFLFLQD
jgi:hypothetical protein